MDQMLQNRIQALLGDGMPMSFQKGGEVFDIDDPATMEESSMAISEPVSDPNESLRQAVDALMMAEATAEDPFEARKAKQMAEGAVIGAQAPMGDMALELAQAGRGEDTMLAHLTPGEVILPLGMMDDADFERTVENRFNELNIDPEQYVAGLGIASLNPITGLEEFGFFKKLAKGVKKVVKKVVRPVAQIAQFIPGPHQPFAAMINKAGTVYDVAKGRASPLALASLGTPLPGSDKALSLTSGQKGIGSLFSGAREFLTKGDDGVGFFGNIGRGIGSLVSGGGADKVGRFGRIGDFLGGIGDAVGLTDYASMVEPSVVLEQLSTDPELAAQIQMMKNAGLSDAQIAEQLQASGAVTQVARSGGGTPQFIKTIGDALGLGGRSGLEDVYGSLAERDERGRSMLGTLGGVGIAGLLGKLAYDEAKNRRGVPLTPLTQEGATGRYNIEAEIARRMGQPAPNPVEFGLLPTGTIPTLSGGRATPQPAQPIEPVEDSAVMTARYGGPVMAFKDGGNVDMAEFKRMDGKIAGPGTEISDDIPAMLSDGEFVMTGRAVRGAGAFDMQKSDGGIVTLTPNGAESREKGTNLMYDMMDLFAEYADKPKEKRSAA